MIMEGKEATLSLTNRSLSLMVERQGMICGKLPKNTLSLFLFKKAGVQKAMYLTSYIQG
jgi:hypothetical protein